MYFSSVCLVVLCSIVLFQGQVEGPSMFGGKKTRAEDTDPCLDETEGGRASSSRGWWPFNKKTTIRVTSHTAEQLKDFANQFFREGRFAEALRCYNKAIRINPNEPKYYRNRGFCFSRMLRGEEAVADYEKSLELEPSSVRGRFFLGRQLYEMEKFEECIEHLQKALDYGEERNMMSDERSQVITMLENAREKMREIEEAKRKAREEELQIYFKELIMEDLKRQTTVLEESKRNTHDHKVRSGIDYEIRKLQELSELYINELTEVFVEADQERESMASRTLPEFLCDSISYEIMKEPLCTPSGVTYDKTQILKHLETRPTDPMTRLPLRSDQLRENKALKDHIKDYMKKNKLTYTMSIGGTGQE